VYVYKQRHPRIAPRGSMGETVCVLRYVMWQTAIQEHDVVRVAQYIRHGFSVNQCIRRVPEMANGTIPPAGYGLEIPRSSPACRDIAREHPRCYSLLQLAVSRQHAQHPLNMDIVHMLVRAGADVDATTLCIAMSEYSVPLLKLLVRRDTHLLKTCSNGYTMMLLWASGPWFDGVHTTDAQYRDVLRYLVYNEAPLDHTAANGNTPLLVAAASRSQSMIMYLKMMRSEGHFVDVNHRNNNGLSALHMLVGYKTGSSRDHSDTMQSRGDAMLLLLELGADPVIGRGDRDKRTVEDVANNVPEVRTPAQMLSRSDIPPGEHNNPAFPEEPHIDVLLHVFTRYMQTRHTSIQRRQEGGGAYRHMCI